MMASTQEPDNGGHASVDAATFTGLPARVGPHAVIAVRPLGWRPRTRGKERRTRFAHLLASLAEALKSGPEPSALRRRLEEGIREMVPVRAARLREEPARYLPGPPPDRRVSAESIWVDVPTPRVDQHTVLEAIVDPPSQLDDWDVQSLRMAAHLAALVVEIERRAPGARPAAAIRSPGDRPRPLVGSSGSMCRLREKMQRVAATDFTVLVEGESGSGKELVARQIHEMSPRRDGPFVAINCAALVETLLEAELFGIEDRTATGVRGRRGKFEHADGGTLCLDEVSDLSMSAQAKLLRAIQDLAIERVGGHGVRQVDTRIIVATNRSLRTLVDGRLFRQDLFYRLSGVELKVPPLRQRREDILELARHFLAGHQSVRRLDIAPTAAEALEAYDWPGNVRELERLIEAAVALAQGDRLELDDLPPAVRGQFADVLLPSLARGDSMRTWGSRYARLVLGQYSGNKRRACRHLGISYHTLQAYLRYAAECLPRHEAAGDGSGDTSAGGDGGGDRQPRKRRRVRAPDGPVSIAGPWDETPS